MSARTVLVTGGCRGIGRAVVERLAADGHRVVATSRTGEPVEGLPARVVPLEVGDPSSVEACVAAVEEDLGPVEVLVANAGVTDDRLLLRMDEASFAGVLDTNLTGAYRLTRRVVRGMVRARWGRLVYVSSVVGLTGGAGQASYAASKAGLVGFARSLTRELGSRGITSNVVAPGYVDTDMTAVLTAERRAAVVAGVPTGRTGRPEEVAAAVAFLASDDAGYVNGAVLAVDGGLAMGH